MAFVQIAGYPVDLAKTEEYSFENESTDEPVETGADVSDHIKANPNIITLTIIVSDTPIGAIAQDPTRRNAAGATLPGQDAYQRILKLRDDRVTFPVVTSRGTFLNMTIKSFSETRDSKTGHSMQATVVLKQLRFVTNNRTTVRVIVPSTGATQNLGNNASKSWSDITGIKNVIFVITVKNSGDAKSDLSLGQNYTKILGPPVLTLTANFMSTSTVYNYYQINSDFTPNGYVDQARTKFTPLSLTQQQASAGRVVTNTSNVNRPANAVAYDYGRRKWCDGHGNPVTQNSTPGSPPANNDRWNQMTKPGLPSGTP